jgi:hypothetical protein
MTDARLAHYVTYQRHTKEKTVRWFRPVWLFFVPAGPAGWILCGAAVAFCLQVFWVIDRHSHSVSDTLYGIFPFWVPTLLALAWIADRTGGRR